VWLRGHADVIFQMVFMLVKLGGTMDFYDAADFNNIPDGAYACVYADGAFFCPPAQTARFAATRFITVLGGTDAAKYAGCLDWELGNAAFTGNELRDWVLGRKEMDKLARVYVDLGNLPAANQDVGDLDNVRWWLARWGPKLTAQELADAAGGLVRPDAIWGQQFQGDTTGGVDLSVLLGAW
jgi:hypothetical protein